MRDNTCVSLLAETYLERTSENQDIVAADFWEELKSAKYEVPELQPLFVPIGSETRTMRDECSSFSQ